MKDNGKYVPLNTAFLDKKTEWVLTNIDLPYYQIAERKIILWCIENLEGRWTMLGGSKFGFEEPGDAMMFKIQFGFK